MEDQEFVIIWQSARTAQEVVSKTGFKIRTVYTRAQRLRKQGIPLKRMRSRTERDKQELTKLAQRLAMPVN